MRFFATAAFLLASAAVAVANTVTFLSEDDQTRTVHFTPHAGLEELEDITVGPGDTVEVTFPEGWGGMWTAYSEGAEETVGVLGEVQFNSWNDITFFDVSAIDNPEDNEGVHWMYPVGSDSYTVDSWSGCDDFPCETSYNLPDDVQTKSTELKDLVCTLGKPQ